MGYHSKSGNWTQCEKDNGTFLDCPIKNLVQMSMAVALQNPASASNVSMVRIAVPHGKLDIQTFDRKVQTFNKTQAKVYCHEDFDLNLNCHAHVPLDPIMPHNFSLLTVKQDPDADIYVPPTDIEVGSWIQG